MTKHEIWHRGSKSFCDVHRQTGGNYQEQHWKEAPPGEQLPEAVFAEMYRMFLRMESKHPEWDYFYIRYDNENVVPENANNAPFKWNGREWVK